MFSRPSEAMSSTKDGRVVVDIAAAVWRPEAKAVCARWAHSFIIEDGSTLETEPGEKGRCHGRRAAGYCAGDIRRD